MRAIDYLHQVKGTISCCEELTSKIDEAVSILKTVRENDHHVFIFGNGGSASTASHFACDLSKHAGLLAESLTDGVPILTAIANDQSYDDVFFGLLTTKAVYPLDVVIGISASGESENVIRALKYANSLDCMTIGLTGFDGGRLKAVVDLCLLAPSKKIEIVEDIHLIIAHCITTCLIEEKK